MLAIDMMSKALMQAGIPADAGMQTILLEHDVDNFMRAGGFYLLCGACGCVYASVITVVIAVIVFAVLLQLALVSALFYFALILVAFIFPDFVLP